MALRNIPSFSALRAFEYAVRLGSFKEAAEALNISTSAISHQIRSLEKELGKSLFDRQANGVVPTDSARQYLKYVRNAFDQLEKGTDTVRGKQQTGSLQISLLSTLSTLWLIPQLEAFRRSHNRINIELVDNPELVDFNSSRFDAAIRYDFTGNGEWRGLVAHPLVEENIFPVCSPAFLKKYPEVVQLDWRPEHTLLINSRHPDEWDQWCRTAGIQFKTSEHPSCSIMDTSSMTLMAAKNGLGIALARTPFIDQMLKNAELVRIHRAVQKRGIRHFLVYPAEHANRTDLIQFRDWLISLSGQCNQYYAQQLVTS